MPALRLVLLLVFAACAGALEVHGAQKSPVGKVVSMMNDMLAKGKQEKQDEKVTFAAFKEFCTSTLAEKKKAIEKGAESSDQLAADIDKAAADAMRLAKEIKVIDVNMAAWDEDKKKAVQLRKKEKTVYDKTHAEYVDSIASTDAALAKLSEKPAEAAPTLVQLGRVSARLRKAKDPLSSLLQDKALFQESAPEAAAFESSSGSIIDMVKSMQDKFRDEKAELEKREMNMQQSHDLMMADLSGSIKQGKMELGMKTAAKASAEEAGAEAKGELSSVKAALAEDQRFRADLDAECVTKSRDFEKRQVMRAAEIEAINKAIDIMSSPEVMGLVQRAQVARSSAAFAQLRSSSRTAGAGRLAGAADFLQTSAKRVGSPALSLIATRITTASGADIFQKVRKMISDMITKLMDEANAEATEKAFCDTEMGTNKMTRDTLTEEIDSLKAKSEKLSADLSQLAEENAAIQEAIGTVDAQVAKATEDRNNEKAKNQATISDAKVAQAATVKAIEVLKAFQMKAANQPTDMKVSGPISWDPRSLAILKGGGAALVQEDSKPEMASGEYKGMEGGGVLGLLEVIESDFATVVSETEASEAQAATSHESFLSDAKQDKAIKEAEMTHKQEVSTEKSSDLVEANKNLKGAEREMTAALDYFAKLKPDCIDEGESYEEKTARRKEEIESLQEALKIFSGDGI